MSFRKPSQNSSTFQNTGYSIWGRKSNSTSKGTQLSMQHCQQTTNGARHICMYVHVCMKLGLYGRAIKILCSQLHCSTQYHKYLCVNHIGTHTHTHTHTCTRTHTLEGTNDMEVFQSVLTLWLGTLTVCSRINTWHSQRWPCSRPTRGPAVVGRTHPQFRRQEGDRPTGSERAWGQHRTLPTCGQTCPRQSRWCNTAN